MKQKIKICITCRRILHDGMFTHSKNYEKQNHINREKKPMRVLLPVVQLFIFPQLIILLLFLLWIFFLLYFFLFSFSRTKNE